MIHPEFEDRTPREQAGKDEKLFLSIKEGSLQELVECIEAGASINAVDPSGCHPVHYAAGLQTPDCLDYLLECKAEVDTLDYAG